MGKGTERRSGIKTSQRKHRLFYWAILGMLACAACWIVLPRDPGAQLPLKLIPIRAYRPDVIAALNPEPQSRMLVYPYSVVPGGAHSAQELKQAIERDPAVRQHYADFAVAQAHVIHLSSAKLAYVSYRIHNQIFWTSHRVHLKKDEALLTDGAHYARTRCGNQVSDTPRQPVAPRIEPDSSEMDKPQQVTINRPPETASVLPYSSAENSLASTPTGTTPDGPFPGEIADFIPPGAPLTFINHPKSRDSIPPTPPAHYNYIPPIPPSPTPEPGTLLLLGSGAAYLVGRKKFKKR